MADYDQIEMRLLAFYMNAVGDPSMVQAFKDGRDIHVETAKAIFDHEDVSDKERDVAKTFNYATVYGQGIKKAAITLTQEMGEVISAEMGFEMRRLMLNQWPGIKILMRAIEDRLAQRRYITTLHGRHLHPVAAYKALNALIQGTAADIMREALAKVWKWLRKEQCVSHIVNVVHDELIMDVVHAEVQSLASTVPLLMQYEQVHKIIPVEVSLEYSETTWADKEPWSYSL